MIRAIAVAACFAVMAAVPAHADIAKLSATYDGPLSNTVFTITNDSTMSETIALQTSFGPIKSVSLPNLAAGASYAYSFNQNNGGFLTDPMGAGVPDTTTYTLLVGPSNGLATLSSGAFSTASNQTGNYVDFLGNNCQGFSDGCAVALSGVVASVNAAAAVPEPISASLLAVGLGGLGLIRRRRA